MKRNVVEGCETPQPTLCLPMCPGPQRLPLAWFAPGTSVKAATLKCSRGKLALSASEAGALQEPFKGAAAAPAPIAAALPPHALYARPEWRRAIFARRKVWELRPTRASKRGPVCIAESGARRLVGKAAIVDCFTVAWFWLREENLPLHRSEDARVVDTYQRLFAWVLAAVQCPNFLSSGTRRQPCRVVAAKKG